jgi:hypothetical protein
MKMEKFGRIDSRALVPSPPSGERVRVRGQLANDFERPCFSVNFSPLSSRKGRGNRKRFALSAIAVVLFIVVSGGTRSTFADADDAAAPAVNPVKIRQSADGLVMLSLTPEIQERLGLKTAALTATRWQPEVKANGFVIDPSVLAAAVADLESARGAAEISAKELQRQKTLTAQANASVRALETAQATAAHDEVALAAAQLKFKQNWGTELFRDSGKILAQITNNQVTLVQLSPSAGENLPASITSARIVSAMTEINAVDAEFYDALTGVDPQTQEQSLFFLVKERTLPANAAVTGFIKISGAAATGAVIPAAAVLRYEGLGWVYVQNGTNDFTRTTISLERPARDGWFVENISPTNHIIVRGAQAALSAELSSGSFNTGERD